MVTTGKRITKPSDDPTLANRSMSIRTSMNGIEQYRENNNLAKSAIDTSEAVVGDIADELVLLRQEANKVTGSLAPEAKTAILSEISNISNRLMDLSETKYLDRYIFSGTRTDTEPLTANTADPAVPPYLYQGQPDAIEIQIQPAERVQTIVTADAIFNLDGSAGARVRDVFTLMDDLETAVEDGDVTACSDLLSDIDANHGNILGLQASLGARSARLEDNATALRDTNERMKDLLSTLEDVDLPTAIIEWQTQQNVYQAALTVSSSIMQHRTLADHLG
jgi:flagellar hook-associated protein 3 FlgL